MEFQYTNLDHQYYIIVPKTTDALDRMYQYDIYDENGEIDTCFEYMTFFEDSYYVLEMILFDPINLKCGTLINLYEEEVIEYEDLGKVKDVVESLENKELDVRTKNQVSRFIELLGSAIKFKTGLGFYF